MNLSNTVHPSAYKSLAIDSVDHLYAVWSEKTNVMNCEIYYRNYNGSSWSSVINLTQDSVYSGCPKLGNPVTGNDVDLVWVHDHIYPELFVLYMRLNPVGIEEESKLQVRSAEFQIYPNPFKNCITFEYDFMPAMPHKIVVYDVSGRIVAELKPDQSPTNHHCVTWSAGDLPSGVYFISVQGGDCSIAKKIIKFE